jgi:glycosyltransferase involved in cell wall biosynthesis
VNDEGLPKESESNADLAGWKVCVIYDCLFPLTHGGAERWYRTLVDRLVSSGADVTYLTRRQWESAPPIWKGVKVIAVSEAGELYDGEGVRRTRPALAFGLGTFLWLIRHRRQFDAVVVANFPFFSLLATRPALAGSRTPVFVDYHEVWSWKYWRVYAGNMKGSLGALIQQACISSTRFAQVFTEHGRRRLLSLRFKGDVVVLAGLLDDQPRLAPTQVSASDPDVLFVGRHVKHKGVRLLPEILAAARDAIPNLRMTIASDGPETASVMASMAQLGLDDAVTFTGAVSDEELRNLFARATCTVVPSLREGYGIVVAESFSTGTPVVVADNPENLATGLVETGVNGYVVEPSIAGMSRGIVTAVLAGQSLRESTAQWSAQHAATRSMSRSAEEMIHRLASAGSRRSGSHR